MAINTATATMEDIKAAPTLELVTVYNKITKKEIKKFADRKTAEKRTWDAIQMLAPNEDINETDKQPAKKVAVAEVKKPAAEKTPKVAKANKRADYDNRIIELLVKENPKRIGSRAHKKFEILMEHEGKTLGEYKKREGKYATLDMEKGWPATEIRWALNLNLIKLVNPK